MVENSTDQNARTQALSADQSFIVQAPAGSGKTELLTQRILKLLAMVDKPEAILAITFTRKAAAEMRGRILATLDMAKGPKPELPHQRCTWQLARNALSKVNEWCLLENPNRLQIMTIDALCAKLSKQMPLLSSLGSQIQIVEDASDHYKQAARALLAMVESDGLYANQISNLLLHLDNHLPRAQKLLADLLACRDQWLPYIGHGIAADELRKQLELGLSLLVETGLQNALNAIPKDLINELEAVLDFAFSNLNQEFSLDTDIDNLSGWQTAADIFLTKNGTWRKSLTKKQGFPAVKNSEQNAHMKTQALALLGQLQETPELISHLSEIQILPSPLYHANGWKLLNALLDVLPLLCAQLQLQFQQHGVCDYIEMALRGDRALGTMDAPTDLALTLDYRFAHILIDEFQDTSATQFRLIEKLICGWQIGDGRTLFLVGDPMQSIYRFRKADVGLFLRAKQSGIGQVQLTSLQLTRNFRSQGGLIEWFNQTFQQVFPAYDDLASGKVSYCKAHAVLEPSAQPAVIIHPHFQDTQRQADTIVDIINKNPSQNVAILVQARSHLHEIIPILNAAQIVYRAVEIESLLEVPIIQDLLTLTQALLFPADKVAWLALLRAPWCGLSLADLHAVANYNLEQTLIDVLANIQQIEVSDAAKPRLLQLVPIMQQAIFHRGRKPIATWIESTWLALGGPACVKHESDLNHARTYFKTLAELTQVSTVINTRQIEKKLGRISDQQMDSDAVRVEIMTIHKSKGLEFDTVILPGLERRLRQEASQLMLWQELTTYRGNHLLLAPIRHSNEQSDPIYRYLQHQDKKKAQAEQVRLFYVACTRAKSQLHLLGSIKQEQEASPVQNSLLNIIWPFAEDAFTGITAEPIQHNMKKTSAAYKNHRLSVNWQSPIQHLGDTTFEQDNKLVLQWRIEENHAKAIGIAVHHMLYKIGTSSVDDWSQDNVDSSAHYIETLLAELGLHETKACVSVVQRALSKVLNDARGRWILSAHRDAHSEYPLSMVNDNKKVQQIVIDRTFIDSQGTRWIIDFKTGEPEISDAHRRQLKTYGQAMAGLESCPQRLALYFPLHQTWLEI